MLFCIRCHQIFYSGDHPFLRHKQQATVLGEKSDSKTRSQGNGFMTMKQKGPQPWCEIETFRHIYLEWIPPPYFLFPSMFWLYDWWEQMRRVAPAGMSLDSMITRVQNHLPFFTSTRNHMQTELMTSYHYFLFLVFPEKTTNEQLVEDHRLMYRNMHTHSDQFSGTTLIQQLSKPFPLA